MSEPLTRVRAQFLLDDVRMCNAEVNAALIRVGQLLDRIETDSAELYQGICKEMPPDIEIQPRILRSIG